MGYLVIKNGTNKKSYQLTNTCNKPRLRVGNSYVPLTNSTKSIMRARVNGSYIADYKSYTYTGNQGTQTTGTTYLTRASTSNTIYQSTTYKQNIETFTNSTYTKSLSTSGYHPQEGQTHSSTSSKTGTSRSGTTYSHTIARYPHLTAPPTSPPPASYITNITEVFVTTTQFSTTVTATTGTSYQTRASTSGTSYGTKTTNKTLTSSSWG